MSVAVIGESVTPPSTLPATQRAGKLNRTQDPADSLFVSGEKDPIFLVRLSDQDDEPPGWTEWDNVAFEHPSFGPAFEALVRDGCNQERLFEVLNKLDSVRVRESKQMSRVGMERIREGLLQGVGALKSLLQSGELALLTVDLGELKRTHLTLTQVAAELRPLERKTDARRSVDRDVCKAILVRYVRRCTCQWCDREVSEIINGALAPAPSGWLEDIYDERGRFVEIREHRLPDDPWDSISVEAHRRWRGRNKKLIESADLEERWEQALKHSYPSTVPF